MSNAMKSSDVEPRTEQEACPIEVETLQDQLRQHRMLLELGKALVSEMDMDVLFDLIMNRTRQFMGTERCSVFLFDPKKNQLWSRVSTDLRNNEVRFSADQGIAGWVFQNREPLQIDDAYTDPRFYRDVDRLTHFKTRNILCLPLINRHGDCIGTLQIINKISGKFNENDLELLTSVCHYITIALENARLYDELKVLDKAKERVINHLSHELKTPLSILSAALEMLSRQLNEAENPRIEKTVNRGRRQLRRLLDLQGKINDILNQQPVREQRQLLNIIENAANLVEEFREENPPVQAEILEFIAERLHLLFTVEENLPEQIHIATFFREMLQEARSAMDSREMVFKEVLDEGLEIRIERSVLSKVVAGLLKNAIENTPDEGLIELYAEKKEGAVYLEVRDCGVGVTAINSALIFGGFFHTQDTDLYSSKRPYQFNAGGAGADLLRIKVFSERFGFHVDFQTRRCPFIPTDTDLCPGRISKCSFVSDRQGCLTTGGSTFSVNFPLDVFTA